MLLGRPVGFRFGEAGFFQKAYKLLLRIYGKPVDEGKPLPVSFVQAIRFIHDQEGPLRPPRIRKTSRKLSTGPGQK